MSVTSCSVCGGLVLRNPALPCIGTVRAGMGAWLQAYSGAAATELKPKPQLPVAGSVAVPTMVRGLIRSGHDT